MGFEGNWAESLPDPDSGNPSIGAVDHGKGKLTSPLSLGLYSFTLLCTQANSVAGLQTGLGMDGYKGLHCNVFLRVVNHGCW